MRKTSGFGLMELMIAMGVSTMLALGVMEMMAQISKATKSAAVGNDWTSTKSSIFQALTTMSTCDPMMVQLGSTYHLTVNSSSNYDLDHAVEIPTLSYPHGPSGMFSVATENTTAKGLNITKMMMWAISPPSMQGDVSTSFTYNQYSVRMQVNAQRAANLQGGGQAQGFQPYTVDFKILTGPFGPSGEPVPGIPDTIKGCAPL